MNRTELINTIARDTEESKAAVGRFMDSFVANVQTAVSRGEEVKLAGFGKFKKVQVAKRTVKAPKNGAVVSLPATAKPRFTPGQAFKDMVKADAPPTE